MSEKLKMVPAFEPTRVTVWKAVMPDGSSPILLTFEIPENEPFRVVLTDAQARHVRDKVTELLLPPGARKDH